MVHPAWILPFAALLCAIAVMPLWAPHWWEKRYPLVAIPLGLVVAAYYAAGLRDTHFLTHTLREYVSFIVLIGSLYVVAGGIHITVKGESTPLVNTAFLLLGAAAANLIGTTGASMLLIRPWIRMNKYRITAFHVAFFIILVSNVGGALTPIGDPPLFLGFLKGIPFFWIGREMWPIWAFALAALLVIFYVFDVLNFRRAPKPVREFETAHEEWRFFGKRNAVFLGIILAAVFVQKPAFLREAVMLAAAAASWRLTPRDIHGRNHFNFRPIREVAILFLGIFMTMMPALQWLEGHARGLGLDTAFQYFWGTGVLSAVLDNAPTYLNFLTIAVATFCGPDRGVACLMETHPHVIRAVSAGAVFFGACTYIGNGPNFLVKSIADQAKVRTDSFFGYVLRFTVPVLLPVFAVAGFLFLR
jgi:Na+/H+ antiporter NhaD/arsenite permease-like protein